MAKILLVEDDEDLQSVMIFNLTAAGHEVRACGLGFEALKELDSWHPEIVLLDVMLPDISGTEVCRRLRANPALQELAIIMASAKGEDIDKIVGLEIGADDYLVKPFHIRELLLRIRNIEGRPRQSQTVAAPEELEIGVLRINSLAHRVWVANEELELTHLEFKLLCTLAGQRERVHTRSNLLDRVWEVCADVTTRTVDTHVKRLREKMGPARDYIETVRGVGYRFSSKAM